MFWRRSRNTENSAVTEWWQRADAAAETPSADLVNALATSLAANSGDPDAREREDEMLSGLRDLVELAARPLPVQTTQHRVIGADTCHLILPVSGDGSSGYKLFITSARLILSGGQTRTWAWHRVRRLTRAGRDVVVGVAGEGDDLVLRCNTYGDALAAHHIIRQLTQVR